MELQTLANLGEFIGGLGVIISLIYLAVQIKSNTRSQRNDIEARALERLGSLQREMATNIELTELFTMALVDIYKVNVIGRIRVAWWLTELFSAMEFLHGQNQQGNVQAGIWGRWQETLKWWLTYPGVLEWWRCKATPFSPNFTAYVESMILEGYEYENFDAWNEYLTTDE